MPTIEQIRAARALLGWSQDDLARQAGLSQTGVARIENGTNKPNSSTLSKIRSAFDEHNIEFIGNSGLNKKAVSISSFSGQQGFRDFMDDVYRTTRDFGSDTCIYNGVPEMFYKHLGKEWFEAHVERLNQIDRTFSVRIIVEEGNDIFINDSAPYRWLSKELFNERTVYVYGDHIGFIYFSNDDVSILRLSQKETADSFRVMFNSTWDLLAMQPPQGTGRKL